MASQDGNDHHYNGDNGNPHPVPSLLLSRKTTRSSDEAHRSRLNMEKMIMKNGASSRISIKNRAQQIVEALTKKRQQYEDAPDEAERATKRWTTSPPYEDVKTRQPLR